MLIFLYDREQNVTHLFVITKGWGQKLAKANKVPLQIGNIVGEGENAGYQHFLLFQQCFQKPSLQGSLKLGIVWQSKTFTRQQNLEKVQIESILLTTDDRINVAHIMISVIERVENLWEEEKMDTSIFSFSHDVLEIWYFLHPKTV